MTDASAEPRIRLWIVNQYAARYPDAGFTRHHLLARGMVDRGVDTTIFAAANSGPHKTNKHVDHRVHTEHSMGVDFAWLPAHNYSGNGVGRILNMTLFAATLVRRGRRPQRHGIAAPDVVIGSDPQPFATFAGWMLARRFRVPFLIEVRDIWPESLIDILHVSRLHPFVLLLRAMERFLYRHSDGVIGVLPGVGDHVREQVGRAAPPFTWVPNGVAMDTLTPPAIAPPAPAEPGADDPFVVVYTGAHGPPNGLDTILDAARILETQTAADPQTPAVRFEFYGDGVAKNDLMAYTAAHGITSVHFHDAVPKSEVVPLVRTADASIITIPDRPLYRYGVSPNKMFDYLAAGKPVVVASATRRDPVTLAEAGVFARPGDPPDLAATIRRLIALPPAERERLGNNGRRYVAEHHDFAALGRTCADALRAAIATHAVRLRRRGR